MSKLTTIVLCLTAVTAGLYADNLKINTFGAQWQVALPPGTATIVDGDPLDTIRWPIGASPQSGYDFLRTLVVPHVEAVNPPPVTPWFQIGTFTHHNQPVFASITSVQLALDFNLAVEAPSGSGYGPAFNENFVFLFTHEETSNAPPCAYGPVGGPCNDRVTISGAGTTFFNVGGTNYTLELSFADVAGGPAQTSFITQENASNTTNLFGRFSSEVNAVPEPSFYGVMSIGIAGLFFVARRRRSS